jgi:signal peptidase II
MGKSVLKLSFVNLLINRKSQITLALVVFLYNYLFDRFTKFMAAAHLQYKVLDIKIFNDFLRIKYAENTGAFLSLGKDWNEQAKYIVLIIIPIIICIAGFFYLMLKETRDYRIVLGSCIVGGGMGNLVDRLFNNFKVVDFLNFGIGNFRTGILNTADLSVTFGVIILIVFEMVDGRRGKDKKNNEETHTDKEETPDIECPENGQP